MIFDVICRIGSLEIRQINRGVPVGVICRIRQFRNLTSKLYDGIDRYLPCRQLRKFTEDELKELRSYLPYRQVIYFIVFFDG